MIRSGLVLLASLVMTFAAQAHEAHKTSSSPGGVQSATLEDIHPSDVPMTDKDYLTEGFVTRFQDKGTLIVSFTYTNCPSICPVTNAILSGIDEIVVKNGDTDLTIVSLSIDPERDTPDVLHAMAADLDASDRWVWLTASPADNRILLDDLKVEVAALEQHDPMFLIGDVCSGKFTRLIGIPEAEALYHLARSHKPCAG